METVKDFWRRVRAIEPTLPDVALLVSLDNFMTGTTAGQIVEAERGIAAGCIARGTHRLATAEEAEAHEGKREQHRRDVAEARRKEAGVIFATIPKRAGDGGKRKAGA
jgi:hypothetical protein